MKPLQLVGLIACLCPGMAAAQTVPDITAADLRARVQVLADDSMAGRRTGSAGLERASAYVERELARLGLRPGGVGGYRYPVELERTVSRVAASVDGEPLGTDALLLLSGSAGLPAMVRGAGEGRIVDGTGAVQPAHEQLAGAVLLGREGDEGPPRHPVASLAGPGSPLNAILVVTPDTAEWTHLRESAVRGVLTARPAAVSGTGPPVFAVTPRLAERLRTRRPGVFSYRVDQARAPVPAANLVAILPGSDSVLAREYLVLGAHLDHVGVGPHDGGDSIYNGADDDASGSAALLEIAERLVSMAARPARSILFIWHTAEEEGLLGSRTFADRPTVPRGQLVAMLNLDMVSRNHPDSLHVIGSRRLSTALGDAVERANRGLAAPFALDHSLDRPDHPERLYCRSDHLSYARFAVPVVFLTSGLHADYHRPADEAARVGYGKLARVSDLVLRLVLDLGSAPARPRVDRALPPLGAPCA